jgi:hypothetical protein
MKTKLFLTAALVLSLFAASTAQTLPAYLPTDGLVGWWPFNGNANDESGNGNDGAVNGATLIQDRLGLSNSAYDFDGNDYIELPNSIGIENQGQFTISTWINIATTQTTGRFFNQWLTGPGGSGENLGVQLLITTSGEVGIIQLGGSPNGFFLNTNATSNQWYHIALVFDGNQNSSSRWKSYLNGSFVSEGGNSQTPNIIGLSTPRLTTIGAASGFVNGPVYEYFIGKLDDIAIYNRALSPEEITALYTGEPVNPPTACNPLPANLQNGLVGYWPFCGNANDESGNGNDGTVNGATLTEDRFGVANAAYSFDGASNFIDIPLNESWRGSAVTVSAWIKKNQDFQNQSLIIGQSNGRPQLVCNSDFTPGLDNAAFGFRRNSDGFNAITTNSNISNEEWVNIVGTYTSEDLSIYINGILNNTIIHNDGFDNCSQTPLQVGAFNTFGSCNDAIGITQAFYGLIDDIGIWNRALTPEEVQQLYTLNACTFTIYDTTNVTIYDTVSVSVSTTDTLIINTLITAVEPAQENTFLVYPNPASTQITINNGNVAILGGYTMRITNSLGQDVYNQNITQPEVTLDLSTWGGNGLYVLYIVDPQQNMVAVKQIVLQ